MLNKIIELCGNVNFGAIPGISQCDCGVAPPLSQIQGLIILPIGAKSPVDWTGIEDIQGIVDNSDTEGRRGKWLLGIGQIPAQRDITARLGATALKIARRAYELEFEVEITSAAIYTFLLRLQKNYTGFNFWYYTVGGYLFGRQRGLRPTFVTVEFPKGAERDSVEIGIIRLTWYADGDPLRVPMPNLMTGGMPDVDAQINFLMFRQDFPNQSSAALTWTANNGEVPTNTATYLWVYQDGAKLVQTEQYTVTPNTGVGESTITIVADRHYPGASYEVFTFQSTN